MQHIARSCGKMRHVIVTYAIRRVGRVVLLLTVMSCTRGTSEAVVDNIFCYPASFIYEKWLKTPCDA